MRTILLFLMLTVPALAQKPCPKCGRVHTPTPDSVPNQPLMPGEINRDQRAYDWAKREAWLVARHVNGTSRSPGHHQRILSGFRAAGTGNGYSPRPIHCRPYRDDRIVARAVVFHKGRYCWAAIY